MRAESSDNRPSILLVHNYYKIGGGEHTVFENEKALLEENGHQVYCYTRDNHELDGSYVKKAMLPFTTVFSFKTYREIIRLIRSTGAEIVHCHNTFPLISPSVYYAAKKCGIPVVQTIHNFRFLCPCGIFFRNGAPCEECVAHGLRRAVRYGCYRSSRAQTAVVAPMLWIHRLLGTYKIPCYIFLTELNRGKFAKLLQGLDHHSFIKPNFACVSECPVPRDRVENNAYVYVGRLEENKGIRFLLSVWDELPDAELYLFGAGNLEPEVKQAAAKNRHIHYEGFQKREQILNRLGTAQALLFPSQLYEGFPMTLIESFAVGTPALCANIGNQGAIVTAARGGLLYRANDKHDFLKQMAALTEQRDALSVNARRAYEIQFSPPENYRTLQQIYAKAQECMNGGDNT